MTTLWLIRHGRPRIDPLEPPDAWPLEPDGGAVAALREHLPRHAVWYSSPEPKAVGTARLLTAGQVVVVDDLREAVRPARWLDDASAFEAVVRRSLLVPDVPAADGWEPASATRARVEAAVRALLAIHDGGEVVLVGHGTAWTLLVASLTQQLPDLAAWATMRMPDLAVLDAPPSGRAQVRRSWGPRNDDRA